MISPPPPPGLTLGLCGALLDLSTVDIQPIPKTAARLVALGLAVFNGEEVIRRDRNHQRCRVRPIALTDEGRRLARFAGKWLSARRIDDAPQVRRKASRRRSSSQSAAQSR